MRFPRSSIFWTALCAIVVFPAQLRPGDTPRTSLGTENLTYRIEWRMVNAGTANLSYMRSANNNWKIDVNITSAGLVDRLYRVQDTYSASGDDRFCASSAVFDAREGKKHTVTHLTFDRSHSRVDYSEHDAVKNVDKHNSLTIPPCAHEVTGALAALSQLALNPGQTIALPITDGKKVALAKVEAETREVIDVDGKKYNTIRYQAYVFDNVLYKRKGRLFLWLTDDAEHTPVQFRIELGFPIGNIFLQLEKERNS